MLVYRHRTAGTLSVSSLSVSHSISPLPTVLGGLQSSRDGLVCLPAAATSGRVVLNLPARPTDKPQWWIRGVTIQSPAYLLQSRGRFMWWLCLCAWAGFVCVLWQGGWFTHWVGGCVRWVGVLRSCDWKGKLLVGVENRRAEIEEDTEGQSWGRTDGGDGAQRLKKDSMRFKTVKWV